MQISCEKCAAEYVLDERLIPAGGAPVQCTKCGHIFVALPPAAQPARASTQMFGAAQSRPAPPPPAAAPPSEPFRAKTAMFGAPAIAPMAPPEQGGEPPRSRTAMFGAFTPPQQPPAAPEPAEPPRSKTAMFGAFTPPQQPPPAAPEPAEPPRSKTAMFGAFTPPQPQPAAPEPAEPPRSKTAMFGAFTPPQPQPAAPEPTEPPRSKTAMFGAFTPPQQPPAAPEPAEPPRSKTAMFGSFGQAPAPEPTAPTGEPTRGQTQIFGKAPIYDAPTASPPAEPTAAYDDGGYGEAEDSEEGDYEDQLIGGEEEQLPPAPQRPSRIELPPEEPSSRRVPPTVELHRSRPQAPVAQGRGGAGRAVGIVLTLALVAVAAFLSWRVYEKKRNEVPPEVIAAHDQSVRLIRRDDDKSRQQGLDQLESLAAQQARFGELRATYLAGALFEVDELQARIAHRKAEVAELQRRIERLEQEQAPEDWRTRVGAARSEAEALISELGPVEARLVRAQKRVDEAAALVASARPSTPAGERALLGAQALHEAVKGSAEAIALSTRYQASGPAEGWGALAYAEYALNARVPPESIAEALEGLDRLRAADPGLFRASVLAGRLALANSEYDRSISALESVTALNPDHTFARTVLSWAQEAQRERGE